MRRFCDLNIKPKDETQAGLMVQSAMRLGFSRVGVSSPVESGFDTVKRLDLSPKTANELSRELKKHRMSYEIISVECRTKAVARQAAKDRRVDLIRYPIDAVNGKHYLDRQEAGLMRTSGCGFEVILGELFVDDRIELLRRIKYIKRNLAIARRYRIPVVASSGALDVYGLRDPQGLVALLSLLGVKANRALDMVSSTPSQIVSRNREKLSGSYIMPGVWIVEE